MLAAAAVCLGCAVASAQVLYTTQQDFAPATSASSTDVTVGPPGVTGDTDGSTINGLGNATHPGGVGTAGALFLQANVLGYEQVNLGDEAANAPFLAALKNNTKLSLDYTLPQTLTTGTNGYFQISWVFNWTGGYQGFNNNAFFNGANLAAGAHTVTFDYSALQAGLPTTQPSYFQLFLILNSGGSLTPGADVQVYVDNIAVVPEPASLTLLGLGIPALIFVARRTRRT
jgi:PEP-CTERM motif